MDIEYEKNSEIIQKKDISKKIDILYENEFLFKNFLLLKILFQNNSTNENLAKFHEKILIKIVDIILNKSSLILEDKFILKEAFKYLCELSNEYFDQISNRFANIHSNKTNKSINELVENFNTNTLSKNKNILLNFKGKKMLNFFKIYFSRLNTNVKLNGFIYSIKNIFKKEKINEIFFNQNEINTLDKLILTVIDKLARLAQTREEDLNLKFMANDFVFLIDFYKNLHAKSSIQFKTYKSKSCSLVCIRNSLKRKYSCIIKGSELSLNSMCNLKCKKIRKISSGSLSFSDINLANKNSTNNLISIKRYNSLCHVINASKIQTSDRNLSILKNLFPLNLNVNKLPGVGKVYSNRLNEHGISTLGDLLNLYEKNCDKNRILFETKLKYIAFMKKDTIMKLVRLTECLF